MITLIQKKILTSFEVIASIFCLIPTLMMAIQQSSSEFVVIFGLYIIGNIFWVLVAIGRNMKPLLIMNVIFLIINIVGFIKAIL